MTPLAYTIVDAGTGSEPDRTAVVLHGILGAGRNWRSVARTLARAHPRWRFVLPDLRNHGDSGPRPPPHDLSTVAGEVDGLLHGLGGADLVVGHSYGGKVALTWAREGGTAPLWILDSPPGAGGDGSDAFEALRAMRGVRTPAPDRKVVRGALADAGLSADVVAWLSTSLGRGAAGWVWKIDLEGAEAMIRDYLAQDLWPWLTDPSVAVDLVRAGRSDRWSPVELERVAASPAVRLHVLPNAGHWLHVDDPGGLGALLGTALR